MDANRCVCCGKIISEDRQVCWGCERQEVKTGMLLQSLKATPEDVESAYIFLEKRK